MIGIIPAAGKGLRFKELGKQYSKTVLPYKEKPLLVHQIEYLEAQGCVQVNVVLNHQNERTKEILSYYDFNIPVKYYTQENQNGLSGAVLEAIDFDDSMLVLLGDILPTEPFNANISDNAISVQKVHDYSRWCMVEEQNGVVSRFFDKPQQKPDTEYAVSGIYQLQDSQNVKKLIKKQIKNKTKIDNEYQFSTVLSQIKDIKILEIDLLDFGTLEEYLTNRSVKTSRSFNTLTTNGNFITKSSKEMGEKLIHEYNWFNNLPDEVKVHTPRLFSHDFYSDEVHYKMELIQSNSLREIMLFLDSSEETWEEIFEGLFDLLDTMKKYGKPNSMNKMIIDKTKKRIQDISIPIENKLVNLFMEELEYFLNQDFATSNALIHGDFCFSNIMYDIQKKKVTMIDPRGELFGNHFYEVAKLMHSVMYNYDFIDAELYIKEGNQVNIYNKGKENIQKIFMEIIEKRYNDGEIKLIKLLTASLFLSMIPLHSHNTTNQELFYETFKQILRGE